MKKTLALCLLCAGTASAAVRQEISLTLEPERGALSAAVLVRADKPRGVYTFSLHPGLNPASPSGVLTLTSSAAAAGSGPSSAPEPAALKSYTLTLPRATRDFKLTYSGVITDALQAQAQEDGGAAAGTRGVISEQGCYLPGAAGWYPRLDGEAVAFRLRTSLPAPYDSVAGGARTAKAQEAGRNLSTWEERSPGEEIALACGRYAEYSRPGRPALYVFLQEPDEELAGRYLDAAQKYAALYAGLLGPYPHAKFAVVENFRDTGHNLPSLTVLGPKVLRLPFFLSPALARGLLRNWLGSAVREAQRSGNWCEGLTAYLADHLPAEGRGKDRDYRDAALQKYAAYSRDYGDRPLAEFPSGPASPSEAARYGKALLVFHMLRSAIGDELFRSGLRSFYAAYRGRAASFTDLRRAFELHTGQDSLAPFFRHWVERAGAPELSLSGARQTRGPDGYETEFMLRQEQEGAPYPLRVPVMIRLEAPAASRRLQVDLAAREERFTYSAPQRVLSLEVDPDFDLYRRPGPLTADFDGGAQTAPPYARRRPLAALASDFSAPRLQADAEALAAVRGGRAPGTPGHAAARELLIRGLKDAGLTPFQAAPPAGRPPRGWNQPAGAVLPPGVLNVTGIVRGTDKPEEYVVLGAHYDQLPASGAAVGPAGDDKTSGAAVLLELARYYAAHPRARSIVFAAFDGTERGRLGSGKFLEAFPDPSGRISAALNFDAVGRLGAGKLLVLGSASSDKWVHLLSGAGFLTGTGYAPAEEGPEAGDQASFIERGVPALQFLSGPPQPYQPWADTADRLDADGLVKVAEFAKEIIDFLAGPAPFITRPQGTR